MFYKMNLLGSIMFQLCFPNLTKYRFLEAQQKYMTYKPKKRDQFLGVPFENEVSLHKAHVICFTENLENREKKQSSLKIQKRLGMKS